MLQTERFPRAAHRHETASSVREREWPLATSLVAIGCTLYRRGAGVDRCAGGQSPAFAERTRYYAPGVGPSQLLLVVVSYEQTPARIIFRVRQSEADRASTSPPLA